MIRLPESTLRKKKTGASDPKAACSTNPNPSMLMIQNYISYCVRLHGEGATDCVWKRPDHHQCPGSNLVLLEMSPSRLRTEGGYRYQNCRAMKNIFCTCFRRETCAKLTAATFSSKGVKGNWQECFELVMSRWVGRKYSKLLSTRTEVLSASSHVVLDSTTHL